MKKFIELKTIVVYLLIFVLMLVALQQIWYENLFDSVNFLNWDAEHYYYIKNKGYLDFRVAFFPLFPLIWRFLSVDVYGIVILNSLIFLSSFFILMKEFQIRKVAEIALYLSIPSFIFFYLPYTESFFFLCSTAILIGLKRDKSYLVYIGLFFAIICRPAFTIFIPALIISELLSKNREKAFKKIGVYLLLSFIGVVAVSTIQYIDTGEWFKFFSLQKGWGNELQIPKLPLTSWSGEIIIKLDGIAFLIGGLAGCYLIALMFNFRQFSKNKVPKEVIFSLAYLGGITLSVLIFRGGSLFSLNRFVFATPFIIVIINYWINQKFYFKTKHIFLIFFLIFSFWFLFGSYVHIQQILKYFILTLYVLLLFTIKLNHESIRKLSLWLLIISNITFQVIFYLRFLNGQWVG